MPRVTKKNSDSRMFSFLKDQKLTDVVLTAEGNMVYAHKLVLAANSKYFEEIFTALKHKDPVVVLKDISMQILLLILEYLYTGQVDMKDDQVYKFKEAAASLQIDVNFENNEELEVTTKELPREYLTPESPKKLEAANSSKLMDLFMDQTFEDVLTKEPASEILTRSALTSKKPLVSRQLSVLLSRTKTPASDQPRCIYCDVKFRERDRTYHQRHCWKNPKRIKNDCSYCPKRYMLPSQLRIHIRNNHADESSDI